ncbi:hypothetical protein CCP3SC15_20023 [Gammaproteobacteria bacterium]
MPGQLLGANNLSGFGARSLSGVDQNPGLCPTPSGVQLSPSRACTQDQHRPSR